ncbi:hypothetical protein SteCoe_6034 [Stentor coeruleus]|uniref:RING-type domain-containing protein n=1 Tax=Stentor coeruleus TaxID=5963 RepID=A0A1R2CR20_9CILI|nr:hypothetical protein SteCoe_6034 [Stentor coeruleus]
MVKTKKSEKVLRNKPDKVASKSKTFCKRSLMQKAKEALSKNIEISRLLLIQLQEFSWESKTPTKLIVSSHICPICAFNYENQSRLPICLPCGHTICKKCVYSLQHSLLTGCCPFDRKEYFFIDDLLPVNHALIYVDKEKMNKICQLHGMEIIAYCKEDCAVLCGRCIFSHRSHCIIELDSSQVSEIANVKLQNLKNVESRLQNLLEIWEDYRAFISGVVERINIAVSAQSQTTGKDSDKELIENIQNYITKIVQDIENSENDGSVNISQVLDSIKYHLGRVRSFRENYDLMDICEKLAFDANKELDFESPALVKITSLITELEENLFPRILSS